MVDYATPLLPLEAIFLSALIGKRWYVFALRSILCAFLLIPDNIWFMSGMFLVIDF